ncbi:MAG TPA: hypothetical protein VHD32_01305 [Candidatus Didemnitutus sp.]|nr:hypothetical protein [Candidatus Didemnitutus sp.]
MACLLLCAASFYAGVRYGELNGRIEIAASDTSPLMNLLLVESGKEKELMEMNREQLYLNLNLFEIARNSRLVSERNKRLAEQRILFAKDYWQAVGGKIILSDDEKEKERRRVREIQAATGITPGMTINGVEVSPFYFTIQDRATRELFIKYADQKSRLHDFIVGMVDEAKRSRPNQLPAPTPDGAAHR